MPVGSADMPEQLGRYEIVQRLSAGGMGEVFVARVAGPGGFLKPVAVKRIHPHLANDEGFIDMLHDEANVTAAIKHPNVVQIVEVGHEGNSHYVVLDYVSGETLSKIRRELIRGKQQVPVWLVAWVGAEVAAALHAAHEAKSLEGEPLDIIHRDVSLGNIMLADDGRPMLFDFGVAKARQRITHTVAGELKGKVAYMAPEVFHGAKVDRTIDIYALGIVLYELLTGRSPFQGDSDIETLAAIQSGEAPLIHDLRSDVDWLLSAIVMRAMNHSRDERYQTGAQLEQALRDWARKNAQPHESNAAAQWSAATFPQRLEERRALLARVATRQRNPRAMNATGSFSAVTSNQTFGRSGAAYEPASSPSTVTADSMPGLMTEASPSTMGRGTATVDLVAPQVDTPSNRMRWLGIAAAGTVAAGLLGAVVATMVLRPRDDASAAAVSASGATTTAAPTTPLTTPAPATATAPVATATATQAPAAEPAATAQPSASATPASAAINARPVGKAVSPAQTAVNKAVTRPVVTAAPVSPGKPGLHKEY